METITNIARHLTRMAKERPFQEAVIFPARRDKSGRIAYTHLTYEQLDTLSEIVARQLINHGITAGMHTAFMVKPSLEFFVTTFALFKARAIPVLIDPGIGLKNMKRCLKESEAEAFVGIPAAHLARVVLGWKGKASWKKLVSIGAHNFPGTIAYADLLAPLAHTQSIPQSRIDDVAAILFTSGSTGAPKGAIYTHRNFLSQVDLLSKSLGIQVGERDLCTFPLFALFAPALGMTAIIPEMDFTRPARVNPLRIKEAIDNFGISNMFGSPALIRRVAEHGHKQGWFFPSLQRVISAGAPVPAKVIDSFRELLSDSAEFYTPYGATESLPVAIAESRLLLGEARRRHESGFGLCVGTPVTRGSIKILRISDAPLKIFSESDELPNGQIGEIVVSGDQVTRAYFNRDEATNLAKTYDDKGVFFHRMGDLGYIDDEGHLWFCGRKSHRVQTSKGDLFTIPTEAVFNEHPLVARTALVGLGVAPDQMPALCVEPTHTLNRSEKASLFADLQTIASRHAHTHMLKTFLLHPDFPVDIRHNAKIFREKLKVWAEAKQR
ncbi:MAG: AMP-binding protein [Chitinophagaceae bacterium]|nr:AMP-binding protein [Oligoflexus sp.]